MARAKKISVAEELHKAAELYKERNKLYGDTYKNHGKTMESLFPAGIEIEGVHEFNRFGIFNMMISKICRYAANYDSGGHDDSLHDLSVYSQMLKELDND